MKYRDARLYVLALAIAAGLALGGCGGGDEEAGDATSASAPTTTDSGSQGAPPPTRDGVEEGRAAPDRKPPEQGGGGAQQDGGRPAGGTTQGSPQEGSKAPAPGVPTTAGGDNSIQTFGLEAGSGERAEVTATVQSYLDARAAAKWERACSYLAAEQRRSFERLAQGRGCATAMKAFSTGPAAEAAEAEIDVLSLRVDGDTAFLIFSRPDGNVYAMSLSREGGEWKIISSLATQLD